MIADAQPDFHDDRAHSRGIEAAGLAEPISASVETGALDNQRLQGGRVDGVTLVENRCLLPVGCMIAGEINLDP